MNYNFGYIPDKKELPEKFDIKYTLEGHRFLKFQQRLLSRLMYLNPNEKLYLKDWQKLYQDIDKELEEENGNI